MHAHTLRNALIALMALTFSITATSCGRQALSPIPPQRKKIVIHESWKNKIVDTVFSYPGICVISLIILECGDMKRARDKARELAAREGQEWEHAGFTDSEKLLPPKKPSEKRVM
jgi:hypothetical protein